MDLDIEMDDAHDVAHDAPSVDPVRDDILQPDEPEEPGELVDDDPTAPDESRTIVPTKVNIHGVDTLHTTDIRAYVKSHYGHVDRIEWVDDSSANLVLSSDSSARDVFAALSSVEVADPSALAVGETVPAKPFEGKPEISLRIRFAVLSDKKAVGAATRSRYYLLHPEHDPEERRRRQQQEGRSRYRDRDRDRERDRDGDYRRNGGGRRRRDSDEIETFEASMYDDAPQKQNTERDDDLRSYARENRGKELFSGRRLGRDRSASPMRDVDGDDTMGERDRERPSSARNRTRARDIKDRLSTDNSSKELFPSKGSRGGGRQLDELERAIGSARLKEEDRPKIVTVPQAASVGAFNIRGLASQRGLDEGFSIKGAATGTSARELFPEKLGGSNAGKELFDGNRGKRRQRAEDLFS